MDALARLLAGTPIIARADDDARTILVCRESMAHPNALKAAPIAEDHQAASERNSCVRGYPRNHDR